MKLKVDDRESRKVIDEFKRICQCEVKRLKVGDCVCNDVCIERKEISDFIQSVYSGHMFEQAKEMTQYKKRFLIIVGNLMDMEFSGNNNSILAAMASLSVRYNLQMLCVDNYEQYCKLALYIVQKANDGKVIDMRIIKNKQTKKDRKISALTAIEGVSFLKAKLLLEEFGNLTNVVLADEKALEEVKGIGEKLAKNIRGFWC